MQGWWAFFVNNKPVTLTICRTKAILVGHSLLSARHSWTVLLILCALFISQNAYSQTVYVTRTGEKYHDDGCRYLSKRKIETTLKKAKESGYGACSVCKPPTAISSEKIQTQVISPQAPTKTATSTQCTARTKSSARCSRMTTNANGKCWQHQ